MLKILFYVQYPYYFPHFLPIARFMENENIAVHFILSKSQNKNLMKKIADDEKISYSMGEEVLYKKEADFIFFANIFKDAYKLSGKSIFMDHGIGTKHCDYKSALELHDIVLVEGNYRYKNLVNDFPFYVNKIKKVGFSKLDNVINYTQDKKNKLLMQYNLDTNKKTILYAPTFFPSSIERMSYNFPDDFKNYNIIVKPHYLSYSRNKYKKHIKKFDLWKKFSNCIICDVDEYNIVPFLHICDIMISDESSAIFEFTALNKPVILNKFLKLRWSYYLNPKKLLNRMDAGISMYREIGDNANTYKEMVEYVYENTNNTNKYENVRLLYSKDLCGKIDGKVSSRIYNIIKEELNNNEL